MRLVRKLVAVIAYAFLFLPGADASRITAWMRAVTVTSTAFDSTMRRRRSSIESERLARNVTLLQMDHLHEERTLRVRLRPSS
jgi:hypothetical protein